MALHESSWCHFNKQCTSFFLSSSIPMQKSREYLLYQFQFPYLSYTFILLINLLHTVKHMYLTKSCIFCKFTEEPLPSTFLQSLMKTSHSAQTIWIWGALWDKKARWTTMLGFANQWVEKLKQGKDAKDFAMHRPFNVVCYVWYTN